MSTTLTAEQRLADLRPRINVLEGCDPDATENFDHLLRDYLDQIEERVAKLETSRGIPARS